MILGAGTWPLDGIATLEADGAPALTWTLARGYASQDACFAETQTLERGGATHIEIDIHPKLEGLRLRRLSVRWRLPAGFRESPLAGRAIQCSAGPDPTIVWSEDESLALSTLQLTSDGVLLLERDFGTLAFEHTLSALRLYIGPASQCPALQVPEVKQAARRALLIPISWLNAEQKALRDLLSAPEWVSLAVDTLVLDARLNLSAPLAQAAIKSSWAAFAKTCQLADLQAGITALPQVWSPRGYGFEPSLPKDQGSIQSPDWLSNAPEQWNELLGEKAQTVDFEHQKAHDACTQWLLWLKGQNFKRVDLLDLGSSGKASAALTASTLKFAKTPAQHRSEARLLEVLREGSPGLELNSDGTLPTSSAIGSFQGRSHHSTSPRWLAPTWPSTQAREAASSQTFPHAQTLKHPVAGELKRLGAVRTDAWAFQTSIVVHVGPPPVRLSPKPVRRPLNWRSLLDRIRGNATEALPTPPPPAWPPQQFWVELARLLPIKAH